MKSLADAQVAIIGLGLMGGSLAGALQGKCRTIHGIARRQETSEMALARGLIDQGHLDLTSGLRGADIVILATPVRTIVKLLEEIGPLLAPGCLVMDLGSTKVKIMAQMDQLPGPVQPVGGHPMCGKEVSGLEAADPKLFVGHPFIVTPLPRTSDVAVALALALVAAVGARPFKLEPARHDRLVAQISHLPYLLASALVANTDAVASDDPLVWELASSGFRDTTRLAASDVTMMLDILATNRQPVADSLRAYEAHLHIMAQLIEDGNEADLRQMLEDASRRRRTLFR